MKFLHVVGTRPNFIKAAPVIAEMESVAEWSNQLVHTGQHYDEFMSDVFFDQLDIPEPDFYLKSQNLGDMIYSLWKLIVEQKYDYVVVYGDVDSSLAGCMASRNANVPIIHVESGLRSFDKSMPEERNRIIIDHLSDIRFCTEPVGLKNLAKEGLLLDNYLVGNTAIDTLRKYEKDQVMTNPYVLLTLHRPSNVDDSNKLHDILDKVNKLSEPVIFPIHPRTKKNLDHMNYDNIEFIDPLGYVDFIDKMKNAYVIITDSGGIQCEAAATMTPIHTLRENTEHVKTLELGLNQLIDLDQISGEHLAEWYCHEYNVYDDTDGILAIEWDGNSSKRLVEKLQELV